jgi:hypothetical protein
VTSRDQIARLVEPTTPYLGHLMVRSRSRRGKNDNKVMLSFELLLGFFSIY